MKRHLLFPRLVGLVGVLALRLSGAPAAPQPGCECELVGAYLPIAQALASDDLSTAQKAARELVKQAQADGMTGIVSGAQAVAGARDLGAARSAFKPLSAEIVPLVDDDSYVVMTCPMAKADWVQAKGAVANPYYGHAMLNCGEPKAKPAAAPKA